MASTASIVIEVDDSGAISAFRQIGAEGAKIAPSLQPVVPQLERIGHSARQGREAAVLLTEELGIHMPRALANVISDTTLIGPLMRGAFSTIAVVGFIDIAVGAANAVTKFVDKMAGWSESAKVTMDAQSELNKTIMESSDKIDKLDNAYRLIGLEGVAAFAEKQKIANEDLGIAKTRVADLTAELRRLQVQAQETETVQVSDPGTGFIGTSTQSTAAADAAKAKIQDLTNALAAAQQTLKELGAETRNTGKELNVAFAKEKADGIREIGVAAHEALTKVQAMTAEANKSGASPEQQINNELRSRLELLANVLTLDGQDGAVREAVAKASVAVEKDASDKRIKLLQNEADKKLQQMDDGLQAEEREDQQILEKRRRMEDETLGIERSSAVALAAPWERANVSIIASYQERMDKIREMLNTGDLDEEHAARQQAAAWNEAFGQMRDRLASQMQSFFDEITSGNIGQAFKRMFEQIVFQMVATWVLGMQGMRAASAGAMGGGPGGILGALFGGGAGGGIFGGAGAPGGTPSILGGGSASSSVLGGLDNLPLFSGQGEAGGAFSLLGLGLSAGQGTALAGMVMPSGSGPQGGGLLGMLGGGGLGSLFGLAAMGGGALLGSGNTALRSIGGLLLGGGLGAGIASTIAGTAIGSALGAFGALLGPIGAVAGFLIPLIMGLFGPHKGDIARVQVMEPLMAQIKIIKDSYDVFQTPYNTGVSELEKLRTDAIANLKKIGGRQVKGNTRSTNKLVDDAETYLKTTEAERQRRAQLTFGAPQFHEGGIVWPGMSALSPGIPGVGQFHGGGVVNANLLEGEGVVNRAGMRSLGHGGLNRLNSGAGPGGDVHVHINAVDAASFDSWLKNGAGGISILRFLRYASNSGMA
ncbi:MAG TPA: hypothetical protein VKQ28_16850 [Candidatus Acidoferrum sp.]|nr:hypothetical protein [Candidatus Acidoferrum sp.]